MPTLAASAAGTTKMAEPTGLHTVLAASANGPTARNRPASRWVASTCLTVPSLGVHQAGTADRAVRAPSRPLFFGRRRLAGGDRLHFEAPVEQDVGHSNEGARRKVAVKIAP